MENNNGSDISLRVLIAPVDSASFSSRLGRALADQGVECWVLNERPHIYHSESSFLGKAKPWGASILAQADRWSRAGLGKRVLSSILYRGSRWGAFLWSLYAVDAVVFVSCTRSFIKGNLDLWVYKLMGKRVIRVYLGRDSRPRFMHCWLPELLAEDKRPKISNKVARRIDRQRRRLNRLAKLSDVVVDNPLCGHFHGRPFINWFHVGFPHDPALFDRKITQEEEDADTTLVRVLHSPSHPKIKGTDVIEHVIEKLQGEGLPIEYTRITGMPRAHVLDNLARCDIVIDELYSDSSMAGLASEAAAFGKPAIVGGYGWGELERHVDAEALPPNCTCEPQELEKTLRSMVNDKEKRQQIGEQAYEFINGYWAQEAVAQRFIMLLGDLSVVPESWWCAPDSLSYWQGLGAPLEHREDTLRALCQDCGVGALSLPENSTIPGELNARFKLGS